LDDHARTLRVLAGLARRLALRGDLILGVLSELGSGSPERQQGWMPPFLWRRTDNFRSEQRVIDGAKQTLLNEEWGLEVCVIEI